MLALAPIIRHRPEAPRRQRLALVSAAGPGLPRTTLRQLIRLRLDDSAIAEQFLQEWQPVVENEVRRYSARGGTADDLTGVANLALWEAAMQYDPQRHHSAPEHYIQNHVHRRVRRAYRSAQGFDQPAQAPAEALERIARPDQQLQAVEQRADLTRAVAQLEPAEQAQFRRYAALALAGMGPDEAARAMATVDGASFAAAKKRLERLRKKVRSQLSRLN